MDRQEEVVEILKDVRYKDWEFYVAEYASYLQIKFTHRGMALSGRKWKLSPHMTRSEIVQTALAAVLAAEEHEAREAFLFRGIAIYGPHHNVMDLLKVGAEKRTDRAL